MLATTIIRTAAASAIVLGTLVAGTIVVSPQHAAGTGVGAAQAASASDSSSNVIDMAYPCGFTHPAFCDNFSEGPAPVKGRGNDLDFRKWSFNRVNAGATNQMGTIWAYYPTTAQHCKTTLTNVTADHDSFLCGSEVPEPEHWMEALNDGGGFAFNDAVARQPFDFTNRTGLIQYGVDAKNAGSHSWWTETWITDQPVPGPDAQGTANGIGILFDHPCGGTVPPGDAGSNKTGIGTIYVVRDYTFNAIPPDGGTCDTTAQPDSANMIQIRLSTTRVEVWMSNHGSNTLHLASSAPINPPLPFSVGYVHFEHVQYNAVKTEGGVTPYQTYHWHDMGFDGPVWPNPRAYEVPDSLTPAQSAAQNGLTGGVNLGYVVDSSGRVWNGQAYVRPFTFNNVDVSAAKGALLNLNTGSAPGGTTFSYQFNNGPTRSYTVPAKVSDDFRQTLSIPVSLADLQPGINTLVLKSSPSTNGPNMPQGTMTVANIDLEVLPAGGSQPAPAADMISCSQFQLMMQTMPDMVMVSDPCGGGGGGSGTSTPMPSMTSMPMSSMTPTSTPTALPASATATATATAMAMATKTPVPPTPTATSTSSGGGTTLGAMTIGSIEDSDDPNDMTGSRFTTGDTGGAVTAMSAYVGSVDVAPYNKYQLAIYTDNNGAPGSLVATSDAGTLTAHAWNSLPLTAALAPNTAYWLMYNSNGSNASLDNMYYNNMAAPQGSYNPGRQTFGVWPRSFPSSTTGNWTFSIYATLRTH